MTSFEIAAGLASRYFVTDPERRIAVVEDPYLVLARDEFSAADLVWLLAALSAAAKPAGMPARKAFPPDPGQLARLVDELACGKPPSVPFNIVNVTAPVFIFASRADEKAMAPMKILKLRGMCMFAAVCLSRFNADITNLLTSAEHAWHGHTVCRNRDNTCVCYGPLAGTAIVAGMERTIIGAAADLRRLRESFPPVSDPFAQIAEPLPGMAQ